MLVTVRHRIGAAEKVREVRADEAAEQARAEGLTDPFEIEARVEADSAVVSAQSLVDARSQQFEDWLALGIFLVLLGGADAYVSAHLSGFPAPVDIRPSLVAREAVEIGVSIPVGGPTRR